MFGADPVVQPDVSPQGTWTPIVVFLALVGMATLAIEYTHWEKEKYLRAVRRRA